jgi:hypothetical protein
MIAMSPELRKAVEQAGEAPVELSDPVTQIAYVVVRADTYQKMCARSEASEVKGLYPAMNAVAASEGWDDPSMDIYDDDQPSSPSR